MSIFESFIACKIFARGELESHRGDQGLALQVHHLLSQGLVDHDIDDDDDDDDDDVQVHHLLSQGLVDHDLDDDIYYDAVSVTKNITSHFRAERQRCEVSRPLGLAGRRPALA